MVCTTFRDMLLALAAPAPSGPIELSPRLARALAQITIALTADDPVEADIMLEPCCRYCGAPITLATEDEDRNHRRDALRASHAAACEWRAAVAMLRGEDSAADTSTGASDRDFRAA